MDLGFPQDKPELLKRETEPKFNIREVKMLDSRELSLLFFEVSNLSPQALAQIFKDPQGPPRTRELIRGVSRDRNAALLVAEQDKQLMGFVHLRILRTAFFSGKPAYAEILNLLARKRFWSVELINALIAKALQWAGQKGISQVRLDLKHFNKSALSFLKKSGEKA